jgi:hypothetical protein
VTYLVGRVGIEPTTNGLRVGNPHNFTHLHTTPHKENE